MQRYGSTLFRELHVRCKRGDWEVWKHGGIRLWRRVVGVAARRYVVLEVRQTCSDVEAQV